MSHRRSLWSKLALAAGACLASLSAAPAEVGVSGAYTTGMSLEVPAFHAITPSVALNYNSNGSNGSVGVGWGLDASSIIQRGQPGHGAPKYDLSDVFYLDGVELIPCVSGSTSPSCLSSGSHSTKIENFKRIEQIANGNWKITAKDGTVSWYLPWELGSGTNQASWNVFRWRLQYVIDTHGNEVRYSYTLGTTGGEAYLLSITYGEGTACAVQPPFPSGVGPFSQGQQIPGTEIRFFWEPRTDKGYYGNGKTIVEAPWRLKSVRVKNAGWTNRAYVLQYATSSSSARSMVSSIQQFGSDVVLCENIGGCSGTPFGAPMPSATSLPAATFETPSMSVAPNTWNSAWSLASTPVSYSTYSNAGFAGIYTPGFANNYPCNGTYPCRIDACSADAIVCQLGDVNGDGRSDRACDYMLTIDKPSGTEYEPHTSLSFSYRDGFSSGLDGPFVEHYTGAGVNAWNDGSSSTGLGHALADMNGDGTDEIFVGPLDCRSCEGLLGTTACSEGPNLPCMYLDESGHRTVPAPRFLTVKGFRPDGGTYVLNSTYMNWPWQNPEQPRMGPIVRDFLRDHYPQLGEYGANSQLGKMAEAQRSMQMTPGQKKRESLGIRYRAPLPGDELVNTRQHFFVADVNGDQKTDFVYIYRDAGANTASVCTALATGSGFDMSRPCQMHVWGWYDDDVHRSRFIPGDFNGDGYADIAHVAYHPSWLEAAPYNYEHESLEILFSNGDGTFGNAVVQHTRAAWVYDSIWLPGDINGDGKTDLVQQLRHGADSVSSVEHSLARIAISLGNGFRFPAYKDTGFPWRLCPTAVKPAAFDLADLNGDGRSDLSASWQDGACGTDSQAYVQAIFAGANDTWGATQNQFIKVKSYTATPGWVKSAIGDVNGDGKADVMSYTATITRRGELCGDSTIGLAYDTYFSPNTADDTHNWTPIEHNGDGRTDMVRTIYKNPGYQISTYIGSGGSFSRSDTTFMPGDVPGVTTPLDNPDANKWMSGDIGSPASYATDGREDLVYVDYVVTAAAPGSPKLNIYTMLSNGDGTYAKRFQQLTPASGFVNTPGQWFLADVNGDGRGDLVHTSAATNVDVLVARGDGIFDWAPTLGFSGGSPNGWRSIDLNGDGKRDLVHVRKTGATQGRVDALLAGVTNGVVGFTHSWQPITFAFDDTRRWRVTDVNGDGLGDLVYLQKYKLENYPLVPKGIKAHYLLGRGNGWFNEYSLGPYEPSNSQISYDDTQNYEIGDVNGDERPDFVLMATWHDGSNYRSATFSLINQYPTILPLTQLDPTSYVYQDARNWKLMNSDADGKLDLVYLSGTNLNSIRFNGNSNVNYAGDRMSRSYNGLMGTSFINYASSAGLHAYMPPGSLWTIVASTSQYDSVLFASPTPTTYTFGGARWSDKERRFLGFATIRAAEGTSIKETGLDLSDSCGSRVQYTRLKTPGEALLTQTSNAFLAVATTPPYTCLAQSKTDYECEGEPACKARWEEYGYDGFGNLTSMQETPSPLSTDPPRKTTSQTYYSPNSTTYLPGLMGHKTISEFGAGWQVKATEQYVYDSDVPQATHPLQYTVAPSVGELRQVWTWNNQDGRYRTRAFQFDAKGNVTRQTDPSGIFQTTAYDCNYQRYPVSSSNALFTTTKVWDIGQGLMTSTIDPNNMTTSYSYDKLNRPTRVDNAADGSFSTTDYLNYGTNIQRIRKGQSDGSWGDGGVLWSESYFDGLGRTYKKIDEGEWSSSPFITDYQFNDASSRVWRQSFAHTSDETQRWTTFLYDAAGRSTRTTLPDGTFTRTDFKLGYDDQYDKLGFPKTTYHDGYGRMSKVTERTMVCPGESYSSCWNIVNHDTVYGYDALNRMTSLRDARNNQTTATYNSLGENTQNCDPDMGCWTYTYTPNSSLATIVDARGRYTETSYDSIGRPKITKHKTAQNGTLTRTITNTYDRDPISGQTMGSSLGRLVQVADTTAEYKGCYTDAPARALPNVVMTGGSNTTIESCVAAAKAQGYAYAGLQYYS